VAHSTLVDALYLAIEEAFHSVPKSSIEDDGALQDAVQKAVRRLVFQEHGKKPVTIVHCVRGN